jgi:hypothetical protein
MDGLTKRAYIFAALCLGLGVALFVIPKHDFKPKTEAWMEGKAPDTVGKYTFLQSDENPKQSYKMPKYTYETLKPFGIVSRVYEYNDKRFDVVLIAGNETENFHDPRVCFTSQGYDIREERKDIIKTKSRGDVPVTIADMMNKDRRSVTCFFYRGPQGFRATTRDLKITLFLARLTGGNDVDGVFYRFIPLNEDTTMDELREFVAQYLDASKAPSNGYF